MAKKKDINVEKILSMEIKPKKKQKKKTSESSSFDIAKFDELIKQALDYNPKNKRK